MIICYRDFTPDVPLRPTVDPEPLISRRIAAAMSAVSLILHIHQEGRWKSEEVVWVGCAEDVYVSDHTHPARDPQCPIL